MAKEKIKLPKASYDILKKVITGYGHIEKNVDVDSLSKLIKMNKFDISAQNAFLSQVGIIEGGNKKNITPLGKKLARAYEHDIIQEIKKSLQEIITSNSFLSNLVSTIRLNKVMEEDSFISHILYAADSTKNPKNNTGAKAVKEMLVAAGLINEQDGKLAVETTATGTEPEQFPNNNTPNIPTAGSNPNTNPDKNKPEIPPIPSALGSVLPQININIQLTIPETDNQSVYDNLFKAMKKYLMSNDEE